MRFAANTRGAILRRLASGPATAKEMLGECAPTINALHAALSALRRRGQIEAVSGGVWGDGRVKLYQLSNQPRSK